MRLDVIQYASKGASSLRLTDRLVRTLRRSGILFRMDVVTDPARCREAGVRQLPAYALGGRLMTQGAVPSEDELLAQIEQAAAACGAGRRPAAEDAAAEDAAAEDAPADAPAVSPVRPWPCFSLRPVMAVCTLLLLALVPVSLLGEEDDADPLPRPVQMLQEADGSVPATADGLPVASCCAGESRI